MKKFKNKSVTQKSPANIALIKYWGKKESSDQLPLNSSISINYNADLLGTVTRVTLLHNIQPHKYQLNNKLITITEKMLNVFNLLNIIEPNSKEYNYCIESKNHHPSGAGLASSASCFSALVSCLSDIQGLTMKQKQYLTRAGSGSAIRSLCDGFSIWNKEDGQVYKIFDDWEDLNIIVLILSQKNKEVSSTEGMLRSVKTSNILKKRLMILDERIKELKNSIEIKDFSHFGNIIMEDSDHLHEICEDTFPPLHYLTNDSTDIIKLIHQLNKSQKLFKDKILKLSNTFSDIPGINDDNILAYSFDAGCNPILFTLDKHMHLVNKFLKMFSITNNYYDNQPEPNHEIIEKEFYKEFKYMSEKFHPLNQQFEVICSKMGKSATKLSDNYEFVQ